MNQDRPSGRGGLPQDRPSTLSGERGSSTPPRDVPVLHDTVPDDTLRGDAPSSASAHPVGTTVGAVAGAVAAGAAIGSVAGPIGTAVGAALGAAAGGFAGKEIADMVDPTLESEFWRTNWQTRPYADAGLSYDQDYAPAYRHGVDAYVRYPERHFDEIETHLSEGWRDARGPSSLEWERARPAARDAWDRVKDRVERAMPGDADGDGR
jgi:hypothetical protein